MAGLTDPAKDIYELCNRLNVDSGENGDQFLANQLEVVAWSSDFYRSIHHILDRFDSLCLVVMTLEYDDDLKREIINDIDVIKGAFSGTNLLRPWHTGGKNHFSRNSYRTFGSISPAIRAKISYPLLSSEERDEILSKCEDLRSWLMEAELSDKDFIRQSLIEGLSVFIFRMERINFFGWGFAIDGLNEVISAYLLLERDVHGSDRPDAAAALHKVKMCINSIFKKAGILKDVVEIGELGLKIIESKAGVLIVGVISGYLTSN